MKAQQMPKPLLQRSPCHGCADVESDRCWCEKYRQADALIEAAAVTVAALQRMALVPPAVLSDLAASIADAFDNALYDVGARLDYKEFVARATGERTP